MFRSFRKDFLFLVKSIKSSEVFHNSKNKFSPPQNPKKSSSSQKSDQRNKATDQGVKTAEHGQHLPPQSNFSGMKVTSIRSHTASLICNSRRSSSANKGMKPNKTMPHTKADGMNTISERKSSKQSESVSSDKIAPAQTKEHALLSRLSMSILNEKNSAISKPAANEQRVTQKQHLPAVTVTTPAEQAPPIEAYKADHVTSEPHGLAKNAEVDDKLHLNSQECDTSL